ncbi:hypothetical protein Smp_028170.1 [Schistosoma mansoni]|uniref:UBZ1-type domain-containing protein n=1 Tax=Schistosoma mansoni TaxID=6183 RepID=G4V615_SCHMA|nr:hypothetical protein Smp_028170.1 [Schistosoma mansoni]|eukprot:XP_018648570.1 hypothetical protein Smp_028170.1 [Schistosoma mansoni]
MDSNEEFVVVNEENDSRRDAVARLDVLVDLFKQTIRTLNQSSILLKDELQTAITVTLQSSTPDHSSTVEHLVKQLDDISVSPDEVRKAYVRQLCSRLVAVNEEKQVVMTELVELNNQLRKAEAENRKWKKLIEPILKIETEIKKLDSKLSPKEESVLDESGSLLSDDTTVDDVCNFLNSMHNRIQTLNTEAAAVKETDKSTSETYTQVSLANNLQNSPDKHCVNNVNSNGIQVDSHTLKFGTCLPDEIPLPSMASLMRNIDLKELVREEVSRILSERNQDTSTTSVASVPVDNLLAPVAKTAPTQPETSATHNIPSAPSILNLWSNLSFNGVSSKHVPPPLTAGEEVAEITNINEFNSTPSAPDNSSEQLAENQVNRSNYGSWLTELGLNPCEESFKKPVERPSVPSFSVDEEQPWCPGCHQMFASRADLEEHLIDCLL